MIAIRTLNPLPKGRLAVLLHIRVLVLALASIAALANRLGGMVQAPAELIVLALAVATLALWLRARHDDDGAPIEAFLHLCIDIFLVVVWLALSGAAANPFVFLLIVPVALGAAMLPPMFAAATVLLSIAAYTSLLFLPSGVPPMLSLHGYHSTAQTMSEAANASRDFAQHLWGMWVAFIVTTIFVGAFVHWIAENLRRREAAFNELEKRQLLEQKVIALATLSAGTAHQLGTPLSAIRIAVADLLQEAQDESLREALTMISQQAMSCTRILQRLAHTANEIDANTTASVPLAGLLAEFANELRTLRPETAPIVEIAQGERERLVQLDGGLRLAIMALLDNAAKASPHEVRIEAARHGETLEIKVLDRGAGLHDRTSRKDGMGVGVLLARAAIQRHGGNLEYRARAGGGTLACVTLPLSTLAGES